MIKNTKNAKNDRRFGVIMGMLCAVVATYHCIHSHSLNLLFISIGFVFISIAIIKPIILYPIRIILEVAGHCLGIVNTYFLLTIIYAVFFIPLGFIFKIIGKDSLNLKWDCKAQSYWAEKSKYDESSMKQQF